MSKLRVITYANGKMAELDGRVKDVSISGDVSTCFRTCEVTLNNAITSRKRALTFVLGKEIRVLYDGKEVFRGVLFKQDIGTDGQQSLTAYDYNVYLVKNTDTVVYKNKTATQILNDLCGKFGISTGNVANTSYMIKSHVSRGKTIFDIITIALTTTYKATGRKYRLTSAQGKLSLVDVTNNVKSYVAENERNITSASYSESIEDVRTSVKLTGGDEKKPIKAEAKGDTSVYGTMQHYEHLSDVKKASELQSVAKTMLAEMSKPKREFDVDCLGDTAVTSGACIAVKEAMTGINGTFYVSADTHNFSANGVYTMTLKLSRTNDVPQMEADKEPAPPKPKPKKKETVKSSKKKADDKK